MSAVNFIHLKGLAHRDIKLENVFLDKNCNIKLADFGCSKVFANAQLSTVTGTNNYMAPEMLSQETYLGPPVDVYACGVVLFMMSVGEFPFFESNDKWHALLMEKPKDFQKKRGLTLDNDFIALI